jgi:glycosyltransferase involved in cell wall biosynthesis
MRVLVVTNAYPSVADPASGVFVERQVASLAAAGVEVEVLHLDRTGGGRRAYLRLSELVRRSTAEVGPDLLHVTYGGVTAAAVTRAAVGRPVVVSFCGTDLLGSTAEPPLRRAVIRAGVVASRFAAVRAAGIVVKSSVLRDALPRSVPRDRVWTIPSGVDFDRFRPLDRDAARARLGWDVSRRHALFPADRARAEKRFPLAEAAVEELRRRGGDVALHALAGVPHDEVPTWINAADAVLLTSTHEGSPNAVKEALACDVPVVSVDVGDVRSLLEGIDGCVVAPAEPAALADGLAAVLSGPGRVEARERHRGLSLERTAERLIEVYETVLDRALRVHVA